MAVRSNTRRFGYAWGDLTECNGDPPAVTQFINNQHQYQQQQNQPLLQSLLPAGKIGLQPLPEGLSTRVEAAVGLPQRVLVLDLVYVLGAVLVVLDRVLLVLGQGAAHYVGQLVVPFQSIEQPQLFVGGGGLGLKQGLLQELSGLGLVAVRTIGAQLSLLPCTLPGYGWLQSQNFLVAVFPHPLRVELLSKHGQPDDIDHRALQPQVPPSWQSAPNPSKGVLSAFPEFAESLLKRPVLQLRRVANPPIDFLTAGRKCGQVPQLQVLEDASHERLILDDLFEQPARPILGLQGEDYIGGVGSFSQLLHYLLYGAWTCMARILIFSVRNQDSPVMPARKPRVKVPQEPDCKYGFPQNYFYISKILRRKCDAQGRGMLLVAWEGWDHRHNSWVYEHTVKPIDNIMRPETGEADRTSQSEEKASIPKSATVKKNVVKMRKNLRRKSPAFGCQTKQEGGPEDSFQKLQSKKEQQTQDTTCIGQTKPDFLCSEQPDNKVQQQFLQYTVCIKNQPEDGHNLDETYLVEWPQQDQSRQGNTPGTPTAKTHTDTYTQTQAENPQKTHLCASPSKKLSIMQKIMKWRAGRARRSSQLSLSLLEIQAARSRPESLLLSNFSDTQTWTKRQLYSILEESGSFLLEEVLEGDQCSQSASDRGTMLLSNMTKVEGTDKGLGSIEEVIIRRAGSLNGPTDAQDCQYVEDSSQHSTVQTITLHSGPQP